MNNEINFKNNPLNGVSLKAMLIELVTHYNFNILFAYLKINCFKTNPSFESSIKFLKKTQWAREKVEVFYMYKFKNLPRVSFEEFETPPRDRIVPDDQKPGEPAELSLEDAERMHKKAAKELVERKQSKKNRSHSRKNFNTRSNNSYANTQSATESEIKPSSSSKMSLLGKEDPWAKWR